MIINKSNYNIMSSLTLKILLLLGLLSACAYASTLMTSLNGNCLNCINSNYDFCSSGSIGGKVDPMNSVCCSGMINAQDTCRTGNLACTWKSTTKNKFSKFFNCRVNSQCLRQPGISDYIVNAFNT